MDEEVKKMTSIKKPIAILAIIIGIVLISGCTGQYDQTSSGVQPTGVLQELSVEASEFSLNPSTITVNAGDTVKITFKNIGTVAHNFVINELGVSTNLISPGATQIIEFVAGQSGTFSFYCSVAGHRTSGMEGQITVN